MQRLVCTFINKKRLYARMCVYVTEILHMRRDSRIWQGASSFQKHHRHKQIMARVDVIVLLTLCLSTQGVAAISGLCGIPSYCASV